MVIDATTDKRISRVWKLASTAAGKFSASAVAIMRGIEGARKVVDFLAERSRKREAKRAVDAVRSGVGLLVACVLISAVAGCASWGNAMIWLDDNAPGLGVATPGPNTPPQPEGGSQ